MKNTNKNTKNVRATFKIKINKKESRKLFYTLSEAIEYIHKNQNKEIELVEYPYYPLREEQQFLFKSF
jgi:Asp-tRNA(Asn)/Glu-tRNA(Gln) amidotransferase C subunit